MSQGTRPLKLTGHGVAPTVHLAPGANRHIWGESIDTKPLTGGHVTPSMFHVDRIGFGALH